MSNKLQTGVTRSIAPAYAIAFLSGSCALVYEIVWMRVFVPVFGLSVYSTTAVICAFMSGLGIGSYVAPSLIRRWTRSLWTLYAAIEVGIAASALLIPLSTKPITGLYVAFSHHEGLGFETILVRFALSFIVLLIPTFFMGLTLPVLAHAFRLIAAEDPVSSKRIGFLYGLNTLGGAAGCLVVGFVLLYQLGIRGTTLITAAINVLLALLVYLVYVRRRVGVPRDEGAAPATTEPAGVDDRTEQVQSVRLLSPQLLLLLYGLIGFISLGYELCWFRILVFYLQSATYSFSVMLAVYLAGIALGSLCYSRFFDKKMASATPGATLKLLGAAQLVIGVFGMATLHIYKMIVPAWTAMVDVLGAQTWLTIVFQKILIAALMVFPPTFLMGVSFPLMARLYKTYRVADSRAIGYLYAANTFGAIAGILITGFVLFNRIGVQSTLTVLAIGSAVIGIVFALRPPKAGTPYRLAVAGLAVLFAVVWFGTPPRMLISHFEKHVGKILFYKETASDITFVNEAGGFRTLWFNDGRGTSNTTPMINYMNRLLAYSAMAMNPDAKDVLVICMGCGNTASAFAQFPIDRLDIVDISAGPFEAAHLFSTNKNVLDDPRVHTYVEDGRNYLLRTSRTYDIIQLELPSIHTEGVVNLYTKEFYEIARSKLKDGGVLSQWIDSLQAGREASYMLINTMLGVFPSSAVWGSFSAWWVNGVKSDDPVSIDYRKTAAVFRTPQVRADMQTLNTSFEDVMASVLSAGRTLEQSVGRARTISDDKTVVDFLVPRIDSPYGLGGGVAYYTAPLRTLFMESWQAHGRFERRDLSIPSFYEDADGSRRDAKVRESLLHVADGFPESVIATIRAYQRRRSGLR